MKRVFVLAIAIFALAATSCEDQYEIPTETILAGNNPTSNHVPDTTVSDIPAQISSYVAINFAGSEIRYVIKDVDDFETSYDVYLTGGFELEFDSAFNITEVKGFTKLPDTTIPVEILNYVNLNYSNNFVVQWELDDWRQQIELNNGLELEFTLSGEFIGIDY